MKTKKRLKIILLICIILFCVSAFLLERVISNKVGLLLEKRLEYINTEANKLLALQNSPIKSYVTENSYWDELCNALKKRDTTWVSENMMAPLQTPLYQANFLWIVDDKSKDIYNSIFKSNKGKITPPSNSFLTSLNPKVVDKFCFKNGETYFEGYVASIVPGNDYERKTKPLGYLLVGKLLDTSYLNGLHSLNADLEFSFIPYESVIPINSVNKADAILTCYKIIPCINGTPKLLKIVGQLPEIKTYSIFVKIALLCYLFFVGLIITILYRYFFRYFFNPLDKITRAFKENSIAPISNIMQKDTELGNIAKLIDTYFNQNHQLQNEIEQRKKSEQDLKVAIGKIQKSTIEKIRAEQSAEAKSEFLSTMSHEIRTPINGVIGIANLLKDEDLTPRQKEYVDILGTSSKHLYSLITDILDFSKIETGKVEFDRTSFNLHSLCHSVFHVFKISAQEKNLSFSYQPDQSVHNSIYGDSVRLSQIITNLLSNAIKFTKKGGVVFSYRLLSKTANSNTIEFSVKDTGIGIKEEEKEKIFQGFSQANKSISTQFGGTGLGLIISKKLIEMQGGKINMKSEYGLGTEFTFYLTFETHAFNNTVEAISNGDGIKKNRNVLNGMKILVAEDNNINVLVISRFLEKWGINFKVVNNGLEVLALIDTEDFDLILMDLHMPKMDGEEATAEIRKMTSKKISKIPIIALTANASVDTQQKLLSNGFTNYISKPFNPDNLFRLLKKYYTDG
jgi:signal transduction histidine kinase/ActR/RegA family two-component response regulator